MLSDAPPPLSESQAEAINEFLEADKLVAPTKDALRLFGSPSGSPLVSLQGNTMHDMTFASDFSFMWFMCNSSSFFVYVID